MSIVLLHTIILLHTILFAFIIQGEELSTCLDIRSLQLTHFPKGFRVIWDWTECSADSSTDETSNHNDDCLSTDSNIADSHDATRRISSVCFKCVGVTRDPSYQHVLCQAFRERRDGRSVAVRLTPEPTNPYDSHAVAFECEIAGCWRVFGYVVKELSDYVLDAINRGEIVHVEFSWIKYKIIRTTGPGYCTAIRVTKSGIWPPLVHSLQDTLFH